ncbi:MAG: nucleotide exchange factor GrpE [Nakamurella sp.]
MTKFGQDSDRGGAKSRGFPGTSGSAKQGAGTAAAGSSDDGRRDEHISVKDNRRIDPKTGQVRQGVGDVQDPGVGGGAGGFPQPGAPAANPGDAANAEQPISATVTADSADLEAARAEAAERTADLQRITAEYANYRKRADRDRQAAAVAGKVSVVSEMLAVLDDFDRAEEHGDLTGGFKTVADKLTGILARVGLSHYGADGDEFDPNIHEAVQFATSADVDHPTVTAVLRAGYLFDERVLRPAVVVVTGPEHQTDSVDSNPEVVSGGGTDGDDADGSGGPSADGAAVRNAE